MIIWNGLGFLVVLIAAAALVLTEFVSETITDDDQFYQQHGWVILIGLLLAAAMTFGLDRLLRRQKERVMIDKETGQELVLRRKHSLFFIPVKWWPAVFTLLGLAFALGGAPR